MRRAIARGITLLGLSACADSPLTQVVVVVEPEAMLRQQSSGVRVVVFAEGQGDAGTGGVLTEQSSAPWNGDDKYTISLVATRTDARYRVEVEAMAGAQVLSTGRLISGYVPGDTRYVRMQLSDVCTGVVCSNDETCLEGQCRSATVDPATFARTIDQVSQPGGDEPAARDAGADLGGDAEVSIDPAATGNSADSATHPAPDQQGADAHDGGMPNNGFAPGTLMPVSRLASGGYTDTERTCAIKPDGSVICWGRGFVPGPAFLFAQGSLSEPIVATGLSNVLQTVHGEKFSCALLAPSRSVVCWGENNGGYLGNGTEVRSDTPTPVPGLSDIVQLSASRVGACALRSDGTVVCWGLKLLPDGSYYNSYNVVPTLVEGLRDIKKIVSNSHYNCAIDASRDLYCWGRLLKQVIVTPTKIEGISYVNQVAIGDNRACAAAYVGNTVSCWGADSMPLEALKDEIYNVVQLSMEDSRTCALMLGGHVTCWGLSPDPELTNTGQAADRVWQVQIEDVLELSATTGRTCARKIDGSVECWGMQLGAGRNVQSHIPVRAAGL